MPIECLLIKINLYEKNFIFNKASPHGVFLYFLNYKRLVHLYIESGLKHCSYGVFIEKRVQHIIYYVEQIENNA